MGGKEQLQEKVQDLTAEKGRLQDQVQDLEIENKRLRDEVEKVTLEFKKAFGKLFKDLGQRTLDSITQIQAIVKKPGNDQGQEGV